MIISNMVTFKSLKHIAPTAEAVSRQSTKLAEPKLTEYGILYLKSLPAQQGRTALFLLKDKNEKEISDPTHNVRSLIHEYGGAAYGVIDNYVIYFDLSSRSIMKINLSEKRLKPELLKAPDKIKSYYGDFDLNKDLNLLSAIKETHLANRVLNSVVLIDFANGKIKQEIKGEGFYANFRFIPGTNKFVFISWQESHMPWDRSRLSVGEVKASSSKFNISGLKKLSISNRANYSVTQLKAPDQDRILFISDLDNYYNLYAYDLNELKLRQLTYLKYDLCQPQWVLGQSNYSILKNKRLVLCAKEVTEGHAGYKLLISSGKKFDEIKTGYNFISYISSLGNDVLFLGSSRSKEPSLGYLKNPTRFKTINPTAQKRRQTLGIGEPRVLRIEARVPFYAFYYRGEKELAGKLRYPGIIHCHGGPTSSVDFQFDPVINFFTSRGFSYVTFDYRGSSSYGREFRNLLNGHWGDYDVQDLITLAKFLINRNLANSLFVRGSSAGGLTLLLALTISDIFKGATSYYGVTDLLHLNKLTHKFEAGYLKTLVGDPKSHLTRYQQRSPVNLVNKTNTPLLMFQGENDPVVPLEQATNMYKKLIKSNKPAKLVTFKGESHGFKKASTIKRALEHELKFYLANLDTGKREA